MERERDGEREGYKDARLVVFIEEWQM